MTLRVALLPLLALFVACGGPKDEGEEPANNGIDDCFQCERDTGDFLPDSDDDAITPQDAGPDASAPDTTPDDTGSDGFNADVTRDDAFVRPPLDAGADTQDVPEPRDTTPEPTELHGFHDCYEWTLTVNQTVFTIKEENIPVFYEVHNTCHTDLRLRTRHSSDFFAVGIHKDGQPWIFLPDCPGTGDPEEQVFSRGDGWARGYIWTPTDFDARLARCGVTFDADARYSIVGYGLEPVPFEQPTAWSEAYPLTDEIEIRLLR
jgi:hypothetical protein